jgi:hypothetical protein
VKMDDPQAYFGSPSRDSFRDAFDDVTMHNQRVRDDPGVMLRYTKTPPHPSSTF